MHGGKVSSVIFAATLAAVLICSVVAAAAATSIPLGSMGKWIDSLLLNYENAVKGPGKKEMVDCMNVGTYMLQLKILDKIRVSIERLEIDIESMLKNADFALGGEGAQADNCCRDIRRARTVILQRIIKHTPTTISEDKNIIN
ncbi:hypothetical protein MIMGU_mgv1a022893mg [Erythranthe guttata]|uniref:Pectinesterase inhibitor domain-containing protein n=1 Tax=Erythranthe guttata TaxID=4155 RepID=A0A022RMJ7_ERYGU|nr:hypothetical protein MIMGU_mgv1a022893mg [Erythranthe guttata]